MSVTLPVRLLLGAEGGRAVAGGDLVVVKGPILLDDLGVVALLLFLWPLSVRLLVVTLRLGVDLAAVAGDGVIDIGNRASYRLLSIVVISIVVIDFTYRGRCDCCCIDEVITVLGKRLIVRLVRASILVKLVSRNSDRPMVRVVPLLVLVLVIAR